MTDKNQEGRCLCGRVVYSLSENPIHTTICHCKMCQKSTGSTSLVEPIFLLDSLSIISGKTTIYSHISDFSKQALHINFCAKCGTKLFQTFDRFSKVVGVFGGTFDDPDWYNRDPENTRHIFVDSAMKGDMLPSMFLLYGQHTTDPTTGEKLKPRMLDSHKLVD